MKKSEVYTFIKNIQAEINDVSHPLDLEKAYEMVDEVIKGQSFYHQTPYFLSEWIVVKGQVIRKDSESFGYFDRYLDSILYSGDIGIHIAYLAEREGKQQLF